MCGIYGVFGDGEAAPALVEGLRRLAYRGYDSAGVATRVGASIEARRASGKLASLEALLVREPLGGGIGIGHTRRATHGRPTVSNAHPHVCGPVAVVHNGIIENHRELRGELEAEGHAFRGDTDSEVLPHLIHHYLDRGREPLAAVRAALAMVRGSYALGILIAGDEERLIAVRRGSPLVVGEGEDGLYLASDTSALGVAARRVTSLEEGNLALIDGSGPRLFDARGRTVRRLRRAVEHAAAPSTGGGERGGYRHYMLKEIHDQPGALGATLEGVEEGAAVDFANLDRLLLIGCGTSHYAAKVAKYWFERYADLPVEVDIASEFRYRSPPLHGGDAAIFISRSGETADTLAALRHVNRAERPTYAVVNAAESSMAREAEGVFLTRAGAEIGVASTKAFTSQLMVLAALAIKAGLVRERISEDEAGRLHWLLHEAPRRIADLLATEPFVAELAPVVSEAHNVLFLGRGALYPIALEGALKLKEVSYIHAEGYAAGELKHGPIALVDHHTPVVTLAPDDDLLEKCAANMQEVAARGGRVLLFGAPRAVSELKEQATAALTLPEVDPFIAPILYVVPLQLLAYHVAVARGTDVDQPRSPAKSVTVE